MKHFHFLMQQHFTSIDQQCLKDLPTLVTTLVLNSLTIMFLLNICDLYWFYLCTNCHFSIEMI